MTTHHVTAVFTFDADDEDYPSAAGSLVEEIVDFAQQLVSVEIAHGRELPSDIRYVVREEYDEGFNVYRERGGQGWSIGHTFTDRASAEAAAATLNGLVALDAQKETQTV